jgi:hypothetical protein
VVVVLLVAVVIIVRNWFYNYYLQKKNLRFFFSGTWIVRRKVGENVGFARDQNRFLLEIWNSTEMIPAIAKNIYMCTAILWFGPVLGGGRDGWKFFLLKIMVDECGSSEMWRNIFFFFPQKCVSINTLELIAGAWL